MTTFYTGHTGHDRDRTSALYRSDEVVVTWQWLYVHGRRYAIPELRDVVRTRQGVHPAVVVAAVIAAAEAMLTVPIGYAVGTTVAWVTVVSALLIPGVVAAVGAGHLAARQELWASYRGQRVPLFASGDGRVFGQVTRAVNRALEAVPLRAP